METARPPHLPHHIGWLLSLSAAARRVPEGVGPGEEFEVSPDPLPLTPDP